MDPPGVVGSGRAGRREGRLAGFLIVLRAPGNAGTSRSELVAQAGGLEAAANALDRRVDRAAGKVGLASDFADRPGGQVVAEFLVGRRQARGELGQVQGQVTAFLCGPRARRQRMPVTFLVEGGPKGQQFPVVALDHGVQRWTFPAEVADLGPAGLEDGGNPVVDDAADRGIARAAGGIEVGDALEEIDEHVLLEVLDVGVDDPGVAHELPGPGPDELDGVGLDPVVAII